jgi:aminoglycoside phosphotransferase
VTIPVGPIPVPEVVARIAAGRDVVPVWVNELGGVTFRAADGFVKTATPRWAGHLVDEAARLRWAVPFARVPGRLAELPPSRCSGHVDLGQLGVADRWADIAVATLSLGWNYLGGNWAGELLDAYGVTPGPLRMDYYRWLWQAGDYSG